MIIELKGGLSIRADHVVCVRKTYNKDTNGNGGAFNVVLQGIQEPLVINIKKNEVTRAEFVEKWEEAISPQIGIFENEEPEPLETIEEFIDSMREVRLRYNNDMLKKLIEDSIISDEDREIFKATIDICYETKNDNGLDNMFIMMREKLEAAARDKDTQQPQGKEGPSDETV